MKMSQGERAFTAIVVLLIFIGVGFGIWATGQANENRAKDLEIIKICAAGKEIPACSRQR